MKSIYSIVALAVCLLTACTEAPSEQENDKIIRLVKTQEVSSGLDSIYKELPGVVAANREAQLSFRIAGKVEDLLVKPGDIVQEGQLLASLDDTDTQIRLKSDQAAYQKALSDFNRGKTLVGNGTISQSEYNQLESALAAAEANFDGTKQNLAYSSLKAPFSGVIAKREIEKFEEVQAKQIVLILQDVSSIDIKVDIPESIMILANENSQPEVVAIFDAIPGKTFPLTMKEISTQADPDTSTYEVTLTMPTVEGFNILPGMSVTARALQDAGNGNTVTSAMFVPAHAVLEDNTGRFVFVAQAQGDGLAKIERRDVVTGSIISSGLEIVSGLKPGDKLVVAGMSKLFDGLEVRIEQE